MNEDDLQVGDLVFDPLYRKDGIGLVIGMQREEQLRIGKERDPLARFKVYWFKLGKLEDERQTNIAKLF